MAKVPNTKKYDDAFSAFKKSFTKFVNNLVDKINRLTTKTVLFSNSEYEVTLQDNTIYKYDGSDGINKITIKYPDKEFISTIIFYTKASGDINIRFPEGTLFAGHVKLEFFNCEHWELNIHNGIVTAVQLFE